MTAPLDERLRERLADALAAQWQTEAPGTDVMYQEREEAEHYVAALMPVVTEAVQQARPWAECTGAGDCPGPWHVHGCYADTGQCNDPTDHQPSPDNVHAAIRDVLDQYRRTYGSVYIATHPALAKLMGRLEVLATPEADRD